MPKAKGGAQQVPAIPVPPALKPAAPVIQARVDALQPLPHWTFVAPGPVRGHSGLPQMDVPELGPDTANGAPAHIISISSVQVPATEFLTVPPVAQRTWPPHLEPAAARQIDAGPEATHDDADANPGRANAASNQAADLAADSGKRGPSGDEAGSAGTAQPPGNGPSSPVTNGGVASSVDSATVPPGLAVRIDRARKGRYGYSIVGAPSEAYPQSAGLLSGKLVYTVYLRVDTRKDWILQYCLKSQEMLARGPVDAPYPVTIYRPRLEHPPELDAVMVRGRVNADGRFESVAVVSGSQLKEEALMLRCLREWNFRPASLGGEAVPVEVLLIIPPEGLR